MPSVTVPLPPPPPPQFDEEDLLSLKEQDPYAATGPDLLSNNGIPSKYLEKVVAVYDYQAQEDDELTFFENSVIYVTKKRGSGWWEGMLNGQTGLFPQSYTDPYI